MSDSVERYHPQTLAHLRAALMDKVHRNHEPALVTLAMLSLPVVERVPRVNLQTGEKDHDIIQLKAFFPMKSMLTDFTHHVMDKAVVRREADEPEVVFAARIDAAEIELMKSLHGTFPPPKKALKNATQDFLVTLDQLAHAFGIHHDVA